MVNVEISSLKQANELMSTTAHLEAGGDFIVSLCVMETDAAIPINAKWPF